MENQQIRQIYNKIPIKDMSFSDFAKEMRNLSDPIKMREDLADIQFRKGYAEIRKQRIDRAIKRGKTIE